MPDYYDEEKGKIINLAEKIPKLKFSKKIFGIVLVLVIALYLASGIFVVAPEEQGVVRRFGKFIRIESPGLNYHLPYPIETVVAPAVTQVKRIEIGFRTIAVGPPTRYQKFPAEALMLTGDENIVSAEAIVQYKIKDPVSYLFNIIMPEETVRNAAEAALRQVVSALGDRQHKGLPLEVGLHHPALRSRPFLVEQLEGLSAWLMSQQAVVEVRFPIAESEGVSAVELLATNPPQVSGEVDIRLGGGETGTYALAMTVESAERLQFAGFTLIQDADRTAPRTW